MKGVGVAMGSSYDDIYEDDFETSDQNNYEEDSWCDVSDRDKDDDSAGAGSTLAASVEATPTTISPTAEIRRWMDETCEDRATNDSSHDQLLIKPKLVEQSMRERSIDVQDDGPKSFLGYEFIAAKIVALQRKMAIPQDTTGRKDWACIRCDEFSTNLLRRLRRSSSPSQSVEPLHDKSPSKSRLQTLPRSYLDRAKLHGIMASCKRSASKVEAIADLSIPNDQPVRSLNVFYAQHTHSLRTRLVAQTLPHCQRAQPSPVLVLAEILAQARVKRPPAVCLLMPNESKQKFSKISADQVESLLATSRGVRERFEELFGVPTNKAKPRPRERMTFAQAHAVLMQHERRFPRPQPATLL